ncbi:hypothetical protein PACTADRAFT_34953 [Pachysolen tannophilus NRRL Y-2460]|uniref:D-isomer specific 2-hydroxyacid dehydrogenase NAD-binding domain-containing protein n=1 Tax=Pachysolen tannophilus NRRL Y-2460 TaxID=669874 RepID=A0A1E4TQU6_PACTA|nr:hypothetical protein PACTADRAFT_34953 [Pachysolen tannophilus NRRL Y-2460]
MTKFKVLITGDNAEVAEHTEKFKKFEESFEVVRDHVESKEEFIENLQTLHSDVAAIWMADSKLYQYGGPNAFIDYFPPSVKLFCFPWVGYDSIDGPKLRSKGISLCNVGSASASHVADIALYLTLSAFRFTSFFEHSLRTHGEFGPSRVVLGSEEFHPETGLPVIPKKKVNLTRGVRLGGKVIESPGGKTAGIVGLGSIGKEIAKRLQALGMNVLYNKRTPLILKEKEEEFYRPLKYYQKFDEMIPNCDLIVFAVPGSPETKHLINKDSILKVKKGVRIVNIGRGSAIDEEVLFKALDDGTITSVGLDVFQNEPKIDKRFLNRWDVTITPHMGSTTTDNLIDANNACIDNINDVLLNNGPGISLVN